jgi:hypothetical protein
MNGLRKIKEQLKSAYLSKKWWRRVDAMSDTQATAVYFRFIKEGKL